LVPDPFSELEWRTGRPIHRKLRPATSLMKSQPAGTFWNG